MRLISLLGMLLMGLVLAPVAVWAQPVGAKSAAANLAANVDDATRSAKSAALMRDFAFAPTDASMVGAIRLGTILKSELVAAALAETRKSQPDQAAMIGMGMGVLGRITEIRFSVADKSMARTGKAVAVPTAADVLNQMDVVVLISGKIDDGILAMASQAQSAAAKDPNAKSTTPSMAFRRVDADTVLLSTAALLEDALQRLNRSREGSSTSLKSNVLGLRALTQRAELQDDPDFWIAGRIPDVPMTAGVGASVKAFAMGLTLPVAGAEESGLLEMAVDAGNGLAADSLLRMVRDAVAQQKQFAGMVESSVENTTVRVRAKLPKDLAALAASSGALGGTPAVSGSTPRPSPLTPPTSEPKKVRIIGLEEGERQIPLR